MMQLLRHMGPEAQRKLLAGAKKPYASFTVIRGGQPVERQGQLTRLSGECIWMGAWCYHRDELLPTLMVEAA